MFLQRFVTEVIEALGGIVEPIEYALCHVLIPDDFKEHFQGRSELTLAFDFEVAQENPDAEFVTFGSYVLEQVRALANRMPLSTTRFVEVNRLTLASPEKKIMNQLNAPGHIDITGERTVMGVWANFRFKVLYVSDEKEEETGEVWVNLITNEVDERIKQEQNRITYQSQPLYRYPYPATFNPFGGFQSAYSWIETYAQEKRQQRRQDQQLEKDMERLNTYYTELIEENEKRAARKGLSDEKRAEIHDRTKTIELEKEKQLQEIQNKYEVNIEIELDHGILYFVPMLEYSIKRTFRGDQSEKVLYFNPITKEFISVGERNTVTMT